MIQLIIMFFDKARINFAAERDIAIVDRARRVIYIEEKTRGNRQRLSGQS